MTRGMSGGWTRRTDDPAARWNAPRKPRARKDRRRWCRGKEGVEHQVEVVLDATRPRWFACGYSEMGRWRVVDGIRVWGYVGRVWRCVHIRQCQECGKKLDWALDAEQCPTRGDQPVRVEQPWEVCERDAAKLA